MNQKFFMTVLCTIAILMFSVSINAQIPQLINFQGMLTDAAGTPISGNRTVEFRIYDSALGGALNWSETQTVTIDQGLFSVLLGSVTSIPLSLFNGGDRYITMKVDTDPEMTPRKRLVSVGYAFYAYDGDKVDGYDASAFVRSIDGVTPDAGDVDLVAGANVTITPNPGNHEITIAASGGGPVDDGDWTISGDNIYSSVSGNVGIGMTNPGEKLQVAGTIHCTYGAIKFPDGTAQFTAAYNTSGGIDGSGTAFYIPKFTGATTLGNSSIYQSGTSIGIGTTSPGAKLQVQYDGTHFIQSHVSSTSAYTTYRNGSHAWDIGPDGYSGNWYFIKANGTNIIGVHTSGIINLYGDPVYLRESYDNAISSPYRDLYITSIGEVGYISSSIRYKENIRSIEPYAEKIYRLNPVAFDYKATDGPDNEFGLIAEEVQKVFPELVSFDDEGNPETVTYSKLVPLLLNEMIKLKKQNDVLQEKVGYLEQTLR